MLTDFTGPTLPNQLFVFQQEIFNGGNFYQSVFLVLLLQAAVAETFLPPSSPPSPPLPKGNSMGSPLVQPHTATKLSSPGGDGACAIAGSLHLQPQCRHRVPQCICIQDCLFFKRVRWGQLLITVRLNEILSLKNFNLCLITKWKEKIKTIFVLNTRHLKRLSVSRV